MKLNFSDLELQDMQYHLCFQEENAKMFLDKTSTFEEIQNYCSDIDYIEELHILSPVFRNKIDIIYRNKEDRLRKIEIINDKLYLQTRNLIAEMITGSWNRWSAIRAPEVQINQWPTYIFSYNSHGLWGKYKDIKFLVSKLDIYVKLV